jgi:hypothetical protein
MELNFNPPPAPGKLFKYGSQNYKIYESLLSGGITGGEIQEIFKVQSHTSRISQIRKKLAPHLFRVVGKKQPDKNCFYELKQQA